MRATVLLVLLLLLSIAAGAQSSGHRVADALGGDFIGGRIIDGKVPKGCEGFLMLWVEFKVPAGFTAHSHEAFRPLLMPNPEGAIAVGGRVVFKGPRYPQGDSASDGKYLSYEFKAASLIERAGKPVQLVFDTETVGGVSYHFEGVYLESGTQAGGGGESHLVGRMTQIKGGRKHGTTLSFSPLHIID